MQIKFLIDECLSGLLVHEARNRGYPETNKVDWIGLSSTPDHVIMREILKNDWTFVTNNSKHFRPREGSFTPCYTNVPLHAGLICLDYPNNSILDDQIEYFRQSLTEIERQGHDMINKCVNVAPSESSKGEISVKIFEMP